MRPDRPPDVTAAARGGSRKVPHESVASKATPRFYYERPFGVAVVFFGMAKPWGFYSTAAEADAEVDKLKKLEFHAERVAP